jgi:aspartate kinase
MLVMKFGGTSVGDAERITAVAKIIESAREARPVVILSAMGGITNALLEAGDAAVNGRTRDRDDKIWEIRSRHERAINELFKDRRTAAEVHETIRPIWEEMLKVYTGVSLLREISTRSRDLIGSMGERLIVPIVTRYLQTRGTAAEAVDARQIIITNEEADFMLVDFDETRRRCHHIAEIAAAGRVPVITGFICATPDGITQTLGRGSSDYSATIVGSCIKAEEIQIWTDVDGVMTADPRIVPNARVLGSISYREAADLSYFGAKVLHPKTIIPAADENIPIRIKNSFNPGFVGTLIASETAVKDVGVKAITSITGLTVISIEGRGIIGLPEVAGRVFTTTAAQRINVLMFSQGSSEQHISLIVSKQDGEVAAKALRREFQHEIEKRRVDRIAEIADTAVIALVGEGMKGVPGTAARAFEALASAGIDVSMIVKGSSELNLSFVLDQQDAQRAVQSLHHAFGLSQSASGI